MEEIKILDKSNAKISTWDKIYCETVKRILNEGILVKNRTGIDTITTGAVMFELHDIEHNFPILETKKLPIKNVLSEIQWIHQVQSNDVRWLKERYNPIWDKWMIDDDGIYRIYEPQDTPFVDKKIEVVDVDNMPITDKYGNDLMAEATLDAKEKGKTIKKAIYYGKEWAYTIGKAYGYNNSITKDPQDVLYKIKNKPEDRRMIIDLRIKENLKYGTLEPCVWCSEWRVIGNKLNLFVHQRSGDIPVGVPFNVTQYAALLQMFASVSNLEAGNLYYSINDAHIYVNQIEPIKKQLYNYDLMKYYETFISENTDDEILKRYNSLATQEEKLRNYLISNPNKIDVYESHKDVLKNLQIMNFMLTKKKPKFEVSKKDNFFDINTEINNDKEYLKENPTGNKDLVLKDYSSMPYIKIPVAQ